MASSHRRRVIRHHPLMGKGGDQLHVVERYRTIEDGKALEAIAQVEDGRTSPCGFAAAVMTKFYHLVAPYEYMVS